MSERRFAIATPRLSDAAEITATSAAATQPASNLLRPQPTDTWEPESWASLAITVHLIARPGVPVLWDLVSLLYANLGAADTWQIVAAPTEGGLDDPTFETPVMPGWPQAGLEDREWVHSVAWRERAGCWDAGAGARTEPWLRILLNVSDPLLPPDHEGPLVFRAGRLYVAQPWQPTYHVDRGFQLSKSEDPVVARTMGGGRRIAARPRRDRGAFTVGFLTMAEAVDHGERLDRVVGASGDVLALYDPADTERLMQTTIYGTMSLDPRVHEDPDVFSRRYQFEEL